MRLDKYIGNLGVIARSEVGDWTKQGLISIDDTPCSKPGDHIKLGQNITLHYPEHDQVIPVLESITIMLHKPTGYVSTNIDDGGHPSYRELLTERPFAAIMNPAGRLDVDTTGLLLCTSNNILLHRIIHPNRKVGKTYLVTSMLELTDHELDQLRAGVSIMEHGTTHTTKPSLITRIDTHHIIITIFEGRYHQIKKMLMSINNKVVGLHRAAIGSLIIGECKVGEFRVLDSMSIEAMFEVDYNLIHHQLLVAG